jgi:hypothetical protein
MYKYTIEFSNGIILEDKKIKEVIDYIHHLKLDEHNYKYIYDRINRNKLDYITHICKTKIDKELQLSHYEKNKIRILQERKENYNSQERKDYIDKFRNTINIKRMNLYRYQKNTDFLLEIDTNLFY